MRSHVVLLYRGHKQMPQSQSCYIPIKGHQHCTWFHISGPKNTKKKKTPAAFVRWHFPVLQLCYILQNHAHWVGTAHVDFQVTWGKRHYSGITICCFSKVGRNVCTFNCNGAKKSLWTGIGNLEREKGHENNITNEPQLIMGCYLLFNNIKETYKTLLINGKL